MIRALLLAALAGLLLGYLTTNAIARATEAAVSMEDRAL
jgi:hypothetical protein